VHPTGGSLRVFKHFAWLEAGSGKVAVSRPAHQRVTLTVGLPFARCFAKALPQFKKVLKQIYYASAKRFHILREDFNPPVSPRPGQG